MHNACKRSTQELTHSEECGCFSILKNENKVGRNFASLLCRRTSFLRLFYCFEHNRACFSTRGQVCSDPNSSKKTMALFHEVFLRFVCFLCVTQLPKTGTRKRSTQTGRAVAHIGILVLSVVSVFSGFRQEV